MATFNFTMEYTETVYGYYTLSVEANSREEAERLVREDPYGYEMDHDVTDYDNFEYRYDTLEFDSVEGIELPVLSLQAIDGYANPPPQFDT